MKPLHLIIPLAALLVASCSTTSRIPADEILYTGVKKTVITAPEGVKIPSSVDDAVREAVNVPPNNCMFSPSVRWPLPIGLWVYNHWNEPKKGIGHWLYNKLVAQPVLVSDVRPEVRTRMIDDILDNNGYFSGSASYQLVQGKNKRKARILYDVHTGPEYTLDSIKFPKDSTLLAGMIDSLARREPYLTSGSRYCIDSLSAVRIRITNALRNRGYYFFRPEYIEYLADSLQQRHRIQLHMTMASNTPAWCLEPYKVGRVNTYVYRNEGGGTPDTTQIKVGQLVVMQPQRLRTDIFDQNIMLRPGRTFSVRQMDLTQSYLSRLGIFNAINISVMPDTLTPGQRLLNVDVACTQDKPLVFSLEANVSSKSNSYIGPGIVLGLTNRNVFGGGEVLNVGLSGSYEWQTGHKGSIFNSYEIGIQSSLAFPRLLAPRFIPRRHRTLNWTRVTLGADLLNRPHYFKMGQINTSFNYDWRATRHVSNTLTLFKLTYTNLMHTTEAFDSIMNANRAVALSFRSQFIPQMAFSYTFDRAIDADNTLNWTFTVQQAGNICWALWRMFGDKGEKRLFGTPFSQFVKGQTQLVWGRRLGQGNQWLMTRVAVGAEHAYGNSSQVPYAEQFYCGGANSVRAFTVRSIGPGSYHVPESERSDDYFDQTGTFLFEANIEWRFPIIGILHGAAFLDAGNVWLLKKDKDRPGGLLRAKTFWKDLATGTGVGLRVDIGMLVLRGDLGIGIHAPYNTGKRGYYNMKSFGKSLAFHLAIGYPF